MSDTVKIFHKEILFSQQNDSLGRYGRFLTTLAEKTFHPIAEDTVFNYLP